MKTRVSPAFIGAFVIGAFALLIVGLLSFGGIGFFSKPQRFVVYFDESIHGLDIGSPVKLRGVRVGRVATIRIRFDPQSNRSVVAVVCELHRDVVTDNRGVVIDLEDREALQSLVDRGLRAQLGVLGLATGLLYVELDFKNPAEYPIDPNLRDARYVAVPATPSLISEFQASAGEIMANIKRIDFAGLSRELMGLLTDSRKQLASADLKGVTQQWKQTGARLEALADSPEIKRTLVNLNGAVADLRATLAKVDAQVEPTSEALAETLAAAKSAAQAFDDTAAEARKFMAGNARVGDDVGLALRQLGEAADAVTRLAEFLERNPNALIMGRARREP